MKKNYFLFFLFSYIWFSYAQNNNQNLEEITTIENGLLENILIKEDSIKTYSIQDRMTYYKVPGVSIAVVKDGKLKWSKGYGFANTDTGTKVDANTLFQAGSISKPVAALSALKLYQDGLLELDADANNYLKGWKIPETKFTETEKVTLEKLLTHTAGTTVHGFPGYQQTDNFPEIIDVLSGKGNTAEVTVDKIPGSIWRYSGGGYTVMEKVVEDVSGLPLEDYMAKNILQPIGMTNSTYKQPIGDTYKNISAAYDADGQLIEGLWNNYPEQAAAGLWTTPTDLAKYCIEIQDIAKGKKDGVLSQETVIKMLTKHKNNWGLGPSLQFEGDSLVFGHGGKNAGFTNNMKAYAHLGHAVIVMTNADNGGKLIKEIENAIYKYYDWPIRQPNVIEIIDLAESDLKQYLGKYEFKAQGFTIDMTIKEKHLFTKTPIGNLNLLPLSKKKFIDLESATVIEFTGGDKIDGFIVNNNFKLDKID